jgi:pimeloyl-ACP methyl ester carboxylesterase
MSWYHAAVRGHALSRIATVPLHLCVLRSLFGVLTLCGTYDVWENRAAQAGRRIPLHLVVLPATGAVPDSDPVVPLDGGPGGSAATHAGIATFVRGAWPLHDVVLVDQRGTGASAPLNCRFYGGGSDSAYLGSRVPLQGVRACRSELERRADLTQYTTSISAADLDDVLRALGYGRVDLVGLSYGGRLALEVVRRFPDRVRSLVLVSNPSPDFLIPLPFGAAAHRALTAVFDDCRQDSACARAFPAPSIELDSVVSRLARGPVPALGSGSGGSAAWTRESFADAIAELLYNVAHARKIPFWIHEMYMGDAADFARETIRARRVRWSLGASGMMLSVICSEDVPFIDSAAAADAMADPPLGAPLLASVRAACTDWPHGVVPPDFHTPVASDVPTFILAGARDPTGATDGDMAEARSLRNSVLVISPDYGHAEMDACLVGLIAAFIERPDPHALDVTCAGHPHVPPFAITSPR